MVRLVRTTAAGLFAGGKYIAVDAGRGVGIVFVEGEDEGEGGDV